MYYNLDDLFKLIKLINLLSYLVFHDYFYLNLT